MIVVDQVSKFYGAHAAVRDLDFRIAEGECVGFLGLNGAGKSTTLRLLSCLLLPTSGRIRVGGFDAEEQPHEIRKLIGYLPDEPPLYPEMRVREFLRFAAKLRRMSSADIERRLPEVLEATGLDRVAGRTISTLSHGYQQRVGIAQAIVHRPKLLILDEPIQGLDPVQIIEMRELIRGLRGEHTILLSSHILPEVERTCDRLLMLHKGRIVERGSEAELAAQTGEMATYREAFTDHYVDLEVRATLEELTAAVGVSGIEMVEVVPMDDEVLRAKLRCATDLREVVAARVVAAGLGLRSMRLASSALEDTFVQLSRDEGRQKDGRQGDEREGAAEGAVGG